MSKLSSKKRREVETMLRAGASNKEIQRTLKVDAGTAKRLREKLGLPPWSPPVRSGHVEGQVEPEAEEGAAAPLEPDLPEGIGEVRIICDHTGRPIEVAFGEFTADAAVIEVVAARVGEMRAATGDGRYVCPTHGLHEQAECEFCEQKKEI